MNTLFILPLCFIYLHHTHCLDPETLVKGFSKLHDG
jgi:hypothetical protein